MLVTQPYPTLCDPVDCSPPGSSVHGILQARILEWVAISSSTDLPHPEIEPQPPILQADSLVLDPPGIPIWSSSSASGFLSKENRNASLKVYLTPMFITAFFTMAKIWKQPVSIDDWMDEEGVVDR